MVANRAIHFPGVHVRCYHKTIAVRFWTEARQWIALEKSLFSKPGQLLYNYWVVFEYLLEFFFSYLLATLVLHTHDLAQCVILNLLLQLCTATLKTKAMLTSKLHGHIVSDGPRPSLYHVSVANRAIVILCLVLIS